MTGAATSRRADRTEANHTDTAATAASSSPGRQPRPTDTPAPTSSGATRPVPAATALASLIAAGPAGPCRSPSTTMLPVTTIEPNSPQQAAPSSVPGSTGASAYTAMPAASPSSDRRSAAARPNRATTRANTSPASTMPTASAVPCRPPTALDTPISSRSSGTDGPNPYRK